MTTTIQVAENLTISKHMEINGVRCEVEAASFTPAIFEGQANEDLLKVMADELIERNIIKEEHGLYYFCESGEPLIPDADWEDEDQTTESNLLIEVASAIRELRRGSDREVKEDGEVVGYWQTPEFIEYLLEIAARCEQGESSTSITKQILTKSDAIRLFERATYQENLWEHLMDDFYDEKTDSFPTIYDVMVALGVSKEEYVQATGSENVDWPDSEDLIKVKADDIRKMN